MSCAIDLFGIVIAVHRSLHTPFYATECIQDPKLEAPYWKIRGKTVYSRRKLRFKFLPSCRIHDGRPLGKLLAQKPYFPSLRKWLIPHIQFS